MRSFPWVIGALLIVLIAGGVGFFLGVGSNVATVVPAAGAPVVYGWHFFGFPFFGFFFFLLFLFVIFAVIRRVAWGGRQPGPGWGGRGYYGHAGWNQKDIPPMADDMLQRWHSRAHGETPPPAPSDPNKPSA